MWILPKQLHTSAFVQDTKASGLDSEEFSQICEKSLSWRGKDSLSRTWLQRWKRENWIKHLCTRTLRPSHTESFEDKWTSYQEASRANPSVLLESVKQLKTQDTSSHTLQKESGSANLEFCFSKTYKESSVAKPGTENQFSNMSSEHWKKWVTEQRQEYSQRKKSAHLINASESSSLGWPTARTSDAEGGRIETEMTNEGFKSKRHKSNQTFGAKLRDAVETHEEEKNWATPQSRDCLGPRRKLSEDGKNRSQTTGTTFGLDLNQQVQKNWATPQTFDSNNLVRTPEKLAQTRAEKNAGCMNLREQVHYPDMDHSRKTAKNWPTASTRDHKGGYTGGRIRDGKVSMDTLDVAVQAHTEGGLLDQANPSTNGKSQESWPTPRANKVHPQITEENRDHLANRKKSNLEEDIAGHCGKATGKLNPNWVEHLMGLPVGWTQLPTEWTDSDC